MRSKVFVIAEAGVNHNGNISIARKLIDAASNAGVDAVKFQTFKTEQIVTRTGPKADYQKKSGEPLQSQYEMLKLLELKKTDFTNLKKYAEEKGLIFLSTPFDHDSIDLLKELDLAIYKIGSGEITNLPYLQHIAKLKKKIILSSGMSTMDEIKEALNILIKYGTKKEDITVLHANTEYPTPFKDVNLKAMQTIKHELGVKTGYSDHTTGIEVSVAAVAMGAGVIEKHFTLDKNMPGPDHKASLEPDELKQLVISIRNIEDAIGDGIKNPSDSEKKNKDLVRKSIVAKRTINRGDIFTEENICVKRPGTGLSPMKWYDILGKKANKDYQEDDLL